MHPYQDFRIRLELLALLGTRMYSDTLFGHLCWQVALREGDQGVAEFLEPFRRGEPPFILSEAFPAGLLPRPLLPRPPAKLDRPEDYAAFKRWQKAPFLLWQDFLRLCQDPAATVNPLPDPWRTAKIPHAAIDRRVDTTGGDEFAGRFYVTEVSYLERSYPTDDCRADRRQYVDLYCRTIPDRLQQLVDLLEAIGKTGFGRDKSLGLGRFRIEQIQPWPHFQALASSGANACVTLSTLVPAAGDPTDGQWQLRVKHGFLGEQASANPFKRPIVQLEPGAVFRLATPAVPPFLGRIVPGVAPGMPQAVQCGLALTVPCRWSDS
ncbi:MAG: hypothetical protein NZ899_14315 [Thermoguttaceae bacterium]|nr:hypothetical protein [Thermoguttaceae bacterium]MDW8080163.1 hypothetical protein [Thermoguttaceae bacterium]